MLSITYSRMKKALLHPKEALLYLRNHLKGKIIQWKIKRGLLKAKQSLEFSLWPLTDLINDIKIDKEVLGAADKICHYEFAFLGINTKALKEIPWQTDLKSYHSWPNDFYLDLKEKLIQDFNKGWEIKNVWELSRFHYLLPLALAYYKTGEDKYFMKWQELILDWIKNNPVYYGPNWIIAMEAAIRACNWILSFEIIEQKIQETKYKIQDSFLEKFLSSLFEHGRFIFQNLEEAPFHSNHYLTDIVGLIYLGLFFKNEKESQKWLSFAQKALEKEMQSQVYDDGVDYELSVSYHRYKTELFLWAAYVLKINKIDLSYSFWLKLGKMMNFIIAITKPNGLAPQIGDSDDSRLHLFWENYYLWERRNYDSLIKLFSLVTGQEIERYIFDSCVFPQGGIYLLKDKNLYLITGRQLACGGKGGSHVHNDLLSFELSLWGEDLIIDPGTYVYTADSRERNKFRSTQAHNTVMIDHQEQNPLSLDPFYFEQRAQIKERQWQEREDSIILELEHNGYCFLKQPIIYRRKFVWEKKNQILSLVDTFQGKGKHLLEWNFHLTPHLNVWLKKENNDKREVIIIGRYHSFLFTAPQELNCVIIEDEVSPSYGVKIPSKTLHFSGFFNNEGTKEVAFKIELIK